MRKWTRGWPQVLGAIALAGAVGCASGRGAERERRTQQPAQMQQRTIVGEVTEVSPLMKNVTIRDEETNQELTLEIEDRSRILQDGNPVDIDALSEGIPVRASYAITADGPIATRVEIMGEPQQWQQPRSGAEQGVEGEQQAQGESQQLHGTVADVSPFFNDLKVKTEEGREVTLEVSDETRIMMDGNEVELGAIPEGSEVRASYNIRPDGEYIADSVEVIAPGVIEGGQEQMQDFERPMEQDDEQNF